MQRRIHYPDIRKRGESPARNVKDPPAREFRSLFTMPCSLYVVAHPE